MEQRISLITLGVSDLKRSVDFYERVVGWKAAPGPPEIAFFDLNGIVFSLYRHDALARDMVADRRELGEYRGFALAHNARSREEVDEIFARLRRNGAEIIKEPHEVFWGGYSGYFSDLDGHRWEIAYNPYWTIREDGRVSMSKESGD